MGRDKTKETLVKNIRQNPKANTKQIFKPKKSYLLSITRNSHKQFASPRSLPGQIRIMEGALKSCQLPDGGESCCFICL